MNSKIVDKFSRVDSKGMTLLTPFVVSNEKRTLYFHIAKTGGSTIHKILSQNNFDDGVLSNKQGRYETKLEYFSNVVENWDKYYKFVFLRNKYDLLVSLWHYDGKPGGTFRTFIHDIVKNSEDQYGFWIDQYYLTVLNGELIFDFVGRQERFRDDLAKAMEPIEGIQYNAALHLNSAKYDHNVHFSTWYDLETSKIVTDKFQDEINYFGFSLHEGLVA